MNQHALSIWVWALAVLVALGSQADVIELECGKAIDRNDPCGTAGPVRSDTAQGVPAVEIAQALALNPQERRLARCLIQVQFQCASDDCPGLSSRETAPAKVRLRAGAVPDHRASIRVIL